MVIDVWYTGKGKDKKFQAVLNDFESIEQEDFLIEEFMDGNEIDFSTFIAEDNIAVFVDKVLNRVKYEILKRTKNE